MKTLTEYMNTTLTGDFKQFEETAKYTYIQLVHECCGTKRDSATRINRQIAKQMRRDGWDVSITGGNILKVKM